jgi:hypothetical protein
MAQNSGWLYIPGAHILVPATQCGCLRASSLTQNIVRIRSLIPPRSSTISKSQGLVCMSRQLKPESSPNRARTPGYSSPLGVHSPHLHLKPLIVLRDAQKVWNCARALHIHKQLKNHVCLSPCMPQRRCASITWSACPVWRPSLSALCTT